MKLQDKTIQENAMSTQVNQKVIILIQCNAIQLNSMQLNGCHIEVTQPCFYLFLDQV